MRSESSNIVVEIGNDDDGTHWYPQVIERLVETGNVVDTGHWQGIKFSTAN